MEFIVGVLLTISPGLNAKYVIVPKAVQEVDSGPEKQVREQLLRELGVARQYCQLSDAQINKVRDSLEGALSAEAKRRTQRKGHWRAMQRFGKNLNAAIVDAVVAETSNVELAQAYREDVEARMLFERRAATSCLIQAIDVMAGLSPPQVESISEVATQIYDQEGWNQHAALHIAWIGHEDHQLPMIKGLDSILTSGQRRYYKKFNEWKPTYRARSRSQEQLRDEVLDQLRTLAESRSELLERSLELTKPQAAKLRLLGRNSVQRIADRKLDAIASQRQLLLNVKGEDFRDMPKADLAEALYWAPAHPVVMGYLDSRWDKLASSALGDTEKQQYAKLREQRRLRQKQFVSYMLVHEWAGQFDLNGKRRVALQALVAKYVKPPQGPGMYLAAKPAVIRGLLEVPTGEFITAMGEANWLRLRSKLEAIPEPAE